MAAPEITATGITIQTYEEVFAELAADFLSIYPGTSLDADTPDGQRIGIEAKARQDMQQLAVYLYNSLDPDLASGLALQRIAKLAGLYPRPATRSSWDLVVNVAYNLTLPVGYRVRDENNQIWFLETAAACVTGDNTVTFLSDTFGPVTGTSGDAIEQATVALGVVSVEADANATPGAAGETDAAFRARRAAGVQNPAYSTAGSMAARVANLPGVTDCAVYENVTDTTDGDGVPAHSLWIVVEGGEAQDIADLIVRQKTGGTGLRGAVTGTVVETITRPDGSEFTITHTVLYDRPTDVPLGVRMTVSGTYDAATIKAAVAASVAFRIGSRLQAGALYAPAYVGTGFVVTDLEISDDDGDTWTDGELDPGAGGKFSLSVSDITITGA